MDKIVVLVLMLAVTLGLFSFSVLGEAADARDLVQFAQDEQDEIQVLMTNPNIVTGEMVVDYTDEGITYVYMSGITPITKDEIVAENYYTMDKEYTNGLVSKITFTETAI